MRLPTDDCPDIPPDPDGRRPLALAELDGPHRERMMSWRRRSHSRATPWRRTSSPR